jgi:CheY-like chemotaxis protein
LDVFSNASIDNNNIHHIVADSSSILVVDDEIDILSVIRRQLHHYGFNTCCFTKPSIALEHYKTSLNTHQLIISDLQMPKMNGFEFARKAREINSNVKLFLMTCFETDDLEVSLLSNSSPSSFTMSIIDEFVRKPFSIEKLIMLINKYIMNGTNSNNLTHKLFQRLV